MADDDTTPVADDDTTPVVDDDSTPVADDDTTPVADDDTTPVADDDSSPVLDDDSTPVADDDTTPVADDDSTPVLDDDSTPIADDDTTPSFDQCFAEIAADPDAIAPDYDVYSPVVASHCQGTNHQDILGVERVVFLGDSVAVGTPPTPTDEFYRSLVAEDLSVQFGLEPPSLLWEWYDLINGTTLIQESGDFASCARWGARTDDLMEDSDQVLSCLPEEERDKTTLVVISMGGNDLSSLTSGFIDGVPTADLWLETYAFMQKMRDAVAWITEPGRFPNGVYVIFSNLYEFTDATGDVTSCPLAELAGFSDAVTDPALSEMVVWAMEEFMHIAVDTGTDMLFLLETFCGHGFNYDDPEGRCYRGADAELWFDLTCIHPNPTGHAKMAEMVMNVVNE